MGFKFPFYFIFVRVHLMFRTSGGKGIFVVALNIDEFGLYENLCYSTNDLVVFQIFLFAEAFFFVTKELYFSSAIVLFFPVS